VHRLTSKFVVLLVVLSSCSEPPAPVKESPFRPVASIHDIMNDSIVPAAESLWNSVAYINAVEKKPATDAEGGLGTTSLYFG
jgi:hypothetical protein